MQPDSGIADGGLAPLWSSGELPDDLGPAADPAPGDPAFRTGDGPPGVGEGIDEPQAVAVLGFLIGSGKPRLGRAATIAYLHQDSGWSRAQRKRHSPARRSRLTVHDGVGNELARDQHYHFQRRVGVTENLMREPPGRACRVRCPWQHAEDRPSRRTRRRARWLGSTHHGRPGMVGPNRYESAGTPLTRGDDLNQATITSVLPRCNRCARPVEIASGAQHDNCVRFRTSAEAQPRWRCSYPGV